MDIAEVADALGIENYQVAWMLSSFLIFYFLFFIFYLLFWVV